MDPLNISHITLESFTQYVIRSRYPMVPTDASKVLLEFLAISNAFGGEAGELQNVVKKIVRGNVFLTDSDLHEKFVHEAGDALHYLLSLITIAGYSPAYVMAENVKKLDERKKNAAQADSVASASAQSTA